MEIYIWLPVTFEVMGEKTEISNTQSFLILKQYSDFFIVMPINIFYKKFVIEN